MWYCVSPTICNVSWHRGDSEPLRQNKGVKGSHSRKRDPSNGRAEKCISWDIHLKNRISFMTLVEPRVQIIMNTRRYTWLKVQVGRYIFPAHIAIKMGKGAVTPIVQWTISLNQAKMVRLLLFLQKKGKNKLLLGSYKGMLALVVQFLPFLYAKNNGRGERKKYQHYDGWHSSFSA